MKKLFSILLLILLGPATLFASPIEPSLRMLPLYARLRIPLFQVVSSGGPTSQGGGGGGGGGAVAWGAITGTLSSQTDLQTALDAKLNEPASSGVIARTGSDTTAARTLTAGTGIVVTNGDGVSGNPTFDYDSAIIPNYASGTGACAATGAVGTFYFRTSVPTFCLYPATDAEYWALMLPLGTGTSGGIPYFTGTANLIASSAALTANMPVIGGGAGATPAVGTVSGNTTQFVTTTGTQTSGDCVKIDANGNHIANGSACGGGTTFDPSTTLFLYDDFLSGTATNGQLGSSGVNFAAISTGTIAVATGSAEHPGLLRLNSHATNDNSGIGVTLNNAASATTYDVYTTHEWQLDTVVLFGSNSTAITNTALYVGLTPSIADPNAAGAGIWIRHDSDDSDTTFIFAVCSSASNGCASAGDDTNQKTVASTITPAAGTYYRFRIRRVASGVGGNPTIYFRVNNETEKTFCSSGCDDTLATIPVSGNLGDNVVYLTRTTTSVMSADLDYMYFNLTGLSRY